MTFEDAYQKLREGTATDEEAAFVARELENVRRISAILDNPSLSDPGIEKAEVETVQRARRAFNRKTLLRTVVIVVCSLMAIATIVCAVLFIPSNLSASEKQKISKAEAIEIAFARPAASRSGWLSLMTGTTPIALIFSFIAFMCLSPP